MRIETTQKSPAMTIDAEIKMLEQRAKAAQRRSVAARKDDDEDGFNEHLWRDISLKYRALTRTLKTVRHFEFGLKMRRDGDEE